jgi:hypothetical protein
MRIDQFEHVLRACQGNTDESNFYVIGTAALLAQHPELAEGQEEIVTSHEVDAWPLSGNHKIADLLEAIGEMSPFHEQFGIYVDPCPPANAILPKRWESRTIQFQSEYTKGAQGHCLEKHDLAVSKLARGEPKDLKFVSELLKKNLLIPKEIEERILLVDPSQPHYQHTKESPTTDIRVRIKSNWKAAQQLTTPKKPTKKSHPPEGYENI